jgi:DNA-binding response OmpR family regulator
MPKVMLIEDDRTMLSLLRTLLRYEGYEVVHLRNEQGLDDVLKSIEAELPSVIVMDINLTYFNGFELLLKIRQSDLLHDTKVLITSGIDYRIKCHEAGADFFILKPFMPEELIETISITLGLREKKE